MLNKILSKFKKELAFKKAIRGKKTKLGKRLSIIGSQFFSFGNHVSIGKYYRLHCFNKYATQDYSPKLIFGDNVYAADYLTVLCADEIVIGKNTMIASFVLITDLAHGTTICETPFIEQPLQTKKVSIGSNCWIGEKVVILPGVTIGDNCIIGAGSIVSKSIPNNSMAVGNPAKVIKTWNDISMRWEKK